MRHAHFELNDSVSKDIVILNLIQNHDQHPLRTMSKQSFNYYVYMLSNDEETLYTGVTGDLFRTSGSIEQGQARNLPHDIVR